MNSMRAIQKDIEGQTAEQFYDSVKEAEIVSTEDARIYSAVGGTSESSRYYVIGLFAAGLIKLAYRCRPGMMDCSLRLLVLDEVVLTPELRLRLEEGGLTPKSEGHWSTHVQGVTPVQAAMLGGGMLTHLAQFFPMDTAVPTRLREVTA